MEFIRILRGRLQSSPTKLIPSPKRASVAAIFRHSPEPNDHDKVQLLFIRRKQNARDPWSGHMAFPGGRTQQGESDLAAAIRETSEEIGIHLKESDIVGRLDDRPVYHGNTIATPFVFYLDNKIPFDTVLQESEVSDALWVDVDFLVNAKIQNLQISTKNIFPKRSEYSSIEEKFLTPLENSNIDFPSIYLPRPDGQHPGNDDTRRQVHDFVLWGLTYTMTSDILHCGGYAKFPSMSAGVQNLRDEYFKLKLEQITSNL